MLKLAPLHSFPKRMMGMKSTLHITGAHMLFCRHGTSLVCLSLLVPTRLQIHLRRCLFFDFARSRFAALVRGEGGDHLLCNFCLVTCCSLKQLNEEAQHEKGGRVSEWKLRSAQKSRFLSILRGGRSGSRMVFYNSLCIFISIPPPHHVGACVPL